MTPEQFCYWLQGYFEINLANPQKTKLNEQQIEIITDHLKLVFKKETPERELKETLEHDARRSDIDWEKIIEDIKKKSLEKDTFQTKPIVTCSIDKDPVYCSSNIPVYKNPKMQEVTEELETLKSSMKKMNNRVKNGGREC